MLDQLADERPRPGGRVEDLHVPVDQRPPEVLQAQPVRPLDHEPHDLVRRIDDPQPVGRLRVIDLVEVLVDHLEKRLLLLMRADLRRVLADRRVVGLQPLQRVPLHPAGEERPLQRIELPRDVVLAVEVRVVEHMREDLLGQDVLDQHLPHVRLAQRRVDRRARVRQEHPRRRLKPGVPRIRLVDLPPQRVEHVRQVGLELLHRRAELGDLRPLPGEEQAHQPVQRLHVGHPAAQRLAPVLPQHRRRRVLEDDVVLRIALGELLADLGVEVVGGILGLPEPQRHPQVVQHRAVGIDLALERRLVFQLRHERQPARLRPVLEQVLERLPHDLFRRPPRHPPQPVDLRQIAVDQNLAHRLPRSLLPPHPAEIACPRTRSKPFLPPEDYFP